MTVRAPSPLWLAAGAGFGALLAVVFPGAGEFVRPVLPVAHGVVVFLLALSLPLLSLGRAIPRVRVWGVLLILNVVVVPLIAFVMSRIVWHTPELQVGLLLVLLSPGVALSLSLIRGAGGDVESVLAAMPLILASQLVLVPLFAVVLSGGVFRFDDLPRTLPTIAGVIVVPTLLAALSQVLAATRAPGLGRLNVTGTQNIVWWAAGAIALTVWAVLPDNLERVSDLSWMVPLSIAFLVLMAPLSLFVASLVGVTPAQRRAVMIAGAGRGGLIVLPITLSLDPMWWSFVPLVVMTQIAIESAGLMVYRSIVPEIVE